MKKIYEFQLKIVQHAIVRIEAEDDGDATVFADDIDGDTARKFIINVAPYVDDCKLIGEAKPGLTADFTAPHIDVDAHAKADAEGFVLAEAWDGKKFVTLRIAKKDRTWDAPVEPHLPPFYISSKMPPPSIFGLDDWLQVDVSDDTGFGIADCFATLEVARQAANDLLDTGEYSEVYIYDERENFVEKVSAD